MSRETKESYQGFQLGRLMRIINYMQEKKMKYQRYKRGQIVLIDFSPSMGSELRGKHFAIVITKKDSPNNGVLTVIPLSSKEKPYYLDIGNFVSKQVYPQLLNITRELYTALANLDSSDENEYNVEDVQKVINNVNEFKKVANIYINKNKKSFALVQNITTVSKIRIKKPVNHYDPIKNLIADSLILDLVDNKIKELFINDK